MGRVLILQPGLRQYRTSFFEQLRVRLADRGHSLQLHYSEIGPRAKSERDQAAPDWAVQTRVYRLPRSGDAVTWMPITRLARQSDLVIVPEASGWLNTYQLLAIPRRRFVLACWGHGPSNDDHARNRLTRTVRRRIAPRFDWWFSYTPGTTRRLLDVGVSAPRITTVFNTVDVESLRNRLARMKPEVAEFRRRHDLGGPTGLFLGAMRPEKNPELLLEIGARIAKRIPGFHMLVGGAGPNQAVISEALDCHEWLRYLGPVFGDDKALAMAASDLMIQPTRMGLVVVDAFAAGLPLVTFDQANHGPEAEYLTNDVQGVRVKGSGPEAYADAVVAVLQDPERRRRFADSAWSSGSNLRIDGMVDRFATGIKDALKHLPVRVQR